MIAFLSAPLGPKAYLQDISTTIYIIRSTVYVAQTLTGDSLVVSHFLGLFHIELKESASCIV